MTRASYVNGRAGTDIQAGDRGLQFGDGLFETMLCIDGRPMAFERHWARLRHGCTVLGIACPVRPEQVLAIAAADGGPGRSVLKLIVTRGPSERGYRPPADPSPTWIVTVSDAPVLPARLLADGVETTWCRTRVAREDAALYGCKHLNRLSQVLARAEWTDAFHEGLMLDDAGHVAEGTASNVFLVVGGALLTPDLARGGLPGTTRQWAIACARGFDIDVHETTVRREHFADAAEVFLTNAVYGVVAVGRLDAVRYAVGPLTERLRHALHTAHANPVSDPSSMPPIEVHSA